MDSCLAEAVSAADKVVNEEKSSSHERSILVAAVRELKDAMKTHQTSQKSAPPKEGEKNTEGAESSLVHYMTNGQQITTFSYACEVMLTGCDRATGRESVGRTLTPKLLSSSLELAATVLRSHIIPTDSVAEMPSFDFTAGNRSGAQIFFSKIVGSSSSVKAVPHHAGANSVTGPAPPKREVRNCLVDAVLSVSDQVLTRDSSDKLLFLYIAALGACAAPRWSRADFASVQPASLRKDFLCAHGERLVRIVKLLFSILRNNTATSSAGITEMVKNTLRSVAKAASHYLDQEPKLTPLAETGPAEPVEEKTQQHPHTASDTVALLEVAASVLSAEGGSSASGDRTVQQDSVVSVGALDFILHCVLNGGPAFRNSEDVVAAVKRCVIPTCIRMSLSADLDVFRLSISILLACSSKLEHALINETSTVFRHVYFRTLSSKLASTAQKCLVIGAFQKYIEEPQKLLGIFLNYDCNTFSQSLYEEMIGYLSVLANPTGNTRQRLFSFHTSAPTVQIDVDVPQELQRKALYTLLLVAESNIQWIGRFESHQGEAATAAGSPSDVPCSELTDPTDPSSTASGDAQPEPDFLVAKRYKDSFRRFLSLFNEHANPKAAIEYLRDSLLFEQPSLTGSQGAGAAEAHASQEEPEGIDESRESARKVARFLRSTEEYLDKMVLGDYFAKSFRTTADREIFEEWINLHDFTNMTLDEALRYFLGGFKLLGEAQIVDKTMELFAAHYCRQNPGTFSSADTAFILSFSICMLNTDAHSAHVKNKMSADGFVKNNKGIDEGNDLDPNLLRGIYERISRNEIVLRPSPYCNTKKPTADRDSQGSEKGKNGAAGILSHIPILRHLTPLATAITDKVLLPLDAASSATDGQEEDRAALKEVMDALQSMTSGTAAHSMFVSATSIEHALPMWEVTVDSICEVTLACLSHLLTVSESYAPPESKHSAGGSVGGAGAGGKQGGQKAIPIVQRVREYLAEGDNNDYFSELIRGLQNTVHVCCAYGNIMHTEVLLEKLFELTKLSQTVVAVTQPRPGVAVADILPTTRLELLCTFLNLFVTFGRAFTAREWQACYTTISLLDMLANGTEGLWVRQKIRLRTVSHSRTTSGGAAENKTPEKAPAPDLWFGDVSDPPPSLIDDMSRKRRRYLIGALRKLKSCEPDLWLEKLFDATQCSTLSQLRMAHGLVQVCKKELQSGRTFSITKLFDFVSICASLASRLQWRELWADASEVFVLGGAMDSSIALPVIEGLRIIALSYLVREELLNYCFQKEVLHPFELIMTGNQDVAVRERIIDIMDEFISFRAEHLASGWHVVFSCLSHAALIPQVVKQAWLVNQSIIHEHLHLLKDCFSDLVFGLTTFACTEADDDIAVQGAAYLVACGHWLQYGLEAPPPELADDAGGITRWSCRFRSAAEEAAAAQLMNRRFPRVSLCAEPLTAAAPLEKPAQNVKTSYHLWVSLFEGLVPVVLVHTSIRVRASAICSLFALLRTHAPVFTAEVQQSLFNSMIVPVVSALTEVSPAHDGTRDSQQRYDYRLLLHLGLRGLITACLDDAALFSLCLEALTHVVRDAKLDPAALVGGLVPALLRVCIDVAPIAAPGSVSLPASATLTMPSQLMPPPLSGAAPSPVRSGILHELDQLGYLDARSSKRSAGWAELQHAPAAGCEILSLGLRAQTDSTDGTALSGPSQQCRASVLHIMSDVLLEKLVECYRVFRDDRETCTVVTDNLRALCLALLYYYVVCKDEVALRAMLRAAAPTPMTTRPHAAAAAEGADTVSQSAAGDSLTQRVAEMETPSAEDPASGAARADEEVPVSANASATTATSTKAAPEAETIAVENLLLAPYVCALLDLAEVVACEGGEGEDGPRALVTAFWSDVLTNLHDARQLCLQAELLRQERDGNASGSSPSKSNMSSKSATAAARGPSVTFASVFPSGSLDLPSAQRLFASRANDDERVVWEWRYLLALTCLRCAALAGTRSAFAICTSNADLLAVMRACPSELEEHDAYAFSATAWGALDLHVEFPQSSTQGYVSGVIEKRLEKCS